MVDVLKSQVAQDFYTESLKILKKSKIPFMVGGTFAVNAYIGINRPTKDLDIFCKAGDYPKILNAFAQAGFKTQVTDERWLAKVFKGRHFFDLIFNSSIAVMPVTDEWLKESQTLNIIGMEAMALPVAELIWSKSLVQSREKFDGNDIAHLILVRGNLIDWKRLFSYMDPHWEILLIHLLRFRFIYPSEREIIPKWLINELMQRLNNQLTMPTSKEKVCRGRLVSTGDFEIDVKEWGFTDIIGWNNDRKKT